ncbi:hypothetical protein ACIG0D_01715 [Streptomyces sp. NPDC052773]|uniref:hypothetical protein n=1 Tax=Streptomyces sp. NPDC052773 TaxID=3365693 RepID=UPI0037CF6D75
MSRLARPTARLADGSGLLARRLAARAAAWCARGRRDDLTGWKAILGVLLRCALLALGVYVLARLVRALPTLMWLLTSWWTIAAWGAGRAPAEETDVPPEGPAPAPDREAVLALLLEVMGDTPAVHLRTVLAHLQERGQWEGRKVGDLRAALERLAIPHERGVKVAGVPTWGVRRRDLEDPSPVPSEETPSAASTAA